jgi:hypothetical protein
MKELQISRQEYIRRLLDAYRTTPGTTGQVRNEDRRLARQLYDRQVPLSAVENALVLASSRRLLRPADAAPLGVVRSLHYFRAVIDEVMELAVDEGYFRYLRRKLEKFATSAGKQ